MGVAYIGAIAVAFHGNPSFTFTGDPTAQTQPATIAGVLEWDQAKQLKELVDNPGRRETVAGVTGVHEVIWPDDDLLVDFRGFYLLQQCQLNPQQVDSLTGLCPFQLTAALVGDATHREVVVPRSASARSTDLSLTPMTVVANPFRHHDAAGGSFLMLPGGIRFTREYDASSPHDSSQLTPTGDLARNVLLHTAGVDSLASVVLPVLPGGTLGVPAWVTDRGGDCRAYDRRSMREVYGPSHPVQALTDLIITNGLFRARLGNWGLQPALHVQAFADGVWREVGTILCGGTTDTLVGARLTKVTPDATTVALAVADVGEVFVTLKRGERMFRVDVPDVRVAPMWSGVPPTSRALAATNFTGKFGNGLDGGGSIGTWRRPWATWRGDSRFTWGGSRLDPDIRFRWPPERSPARWAKTLWVRSELAAAALTAGAGFFTVYDADGFAIVELYLDSADAKIKLRVNDVVKLSSAAMTFAEGADLMVGARFSEDEGLALSVWNGSAVEHHHDLTTIDLGASSFYDFAYWTNFGRWGGESWGDGVWGGEMMYPNGTVDNGMIFDDWISDAEFEALAAATYALDGLPAPESRLIWYGPFDAQPLPTLGAEVDGRQVDPLVDGNGLQKVIAYLDDGHAATAAYLARSALQDDVVDHHNQLAAESEQHTRVR